MKKSTLCGHIGGEEVPVSLSVTASPKHDGVSPVSVSTSRC